MFAAADVHYPSSGGACAALVLASDAAFSTIVSETTVHVEHVAPYQPGEFYLRELPPLQAVLAGHDGVELLVIAVTSPWTQTADPVWAPMCTASSASR